MIPADKQTNKQSLIPRYLVNIFCWSPIFITPTCPFRQVPWDTISAGTPGGSLCPSSAGSKRQRSSASPVPLRAPHRPPVPRGSSRLARGCRWQQEPATFSGGPPSHWASSPQTKPSGLRWKNAVPPRFNSCRFLGKVRLSNTWLKFLSLWNLNKGRRITHRPHVAPPS